MPKTMPGTMMLMDSAMSIRKLHVCYPTYLNQASGHPSAAICRVRTWHSDAHTYRFECDGTLPQMLRRRRITGRKTPTHAMLR